MTLKPGSRWRSAVSAAEVVVVRPPKEDATLECGGHPMLAQGAEAPAGLTIAADRNDAIMAGKRYFDEQTLTEVLCAKAGSGSLSLDGRLMQLREAKPLPASD